MGDSPNFTAAQPLVEALGEPLEQMASPSCVFEGEDREFVYEYGSLYTNPIEGTDIWFDFYITAPGMATSRGLSVGDTVEKMLELYGRYIVEFSQAGDNPAKKIMEQSVLMYGYEGLEDAEAGMRRQEKRM